MLEKFSEWYRNYSAEITWWVIGWLSFAALDCLGRGNYILAAVDTALIYFNYKLWKEKF